MKHKTKVFYMGRQINGRFDSFKAKVRRAFQWLKRVTIVTAAFAGMFMAGGLFFSTSTVTAHMTTVDNTPEKIAALKTDLLNRLSKCEGNTDASAIIIDTNNQVSIGIYKFQIKTVQMYEKKLYGKTVSREDAILIALDDEKAGALASDIIFKEGGIGNWYNCDLKHGFGAEAKVISKLD